MQQEVDALDKNVQCLLDIHAVVSDQRQRHYNSDYLPGCQTQ